MPAPFLPEPIGAVYAVVCPSGRKVYVGQSKDVGQRWTVELNQLAQGLHHNPPLQSDYDARGEAAFAFRVHFRSDDEAARLDAELHTMNKYRRLGWGLYNLNLSRDDGRDWR